MTNRNLDGARAFMPAWLRLSVIFLSAFALAFGAVKLARANGGDAEVVQISSKRHATIKVAKGKPRTIRIGKGGNWFCFPDFIDSELDRVFAELRTKRHLVGLDLDQFAYEAAWFLSETNAIHPFREGNGRTQLAFLRLLCLNAGFAFNVMVLERERAIAAMIDSFDRRFDALTALIRDLAAQS